MNRDATMADIDKLDLDPDYIGRCDWCGEDVYIDEEYEPGNRGNGVMHSDCYDGEAA